MSSATQSSKNTATWFHVTVPLTRNNLDEQQQAARFVYRNRQSSEDFRDLIEALGLSGAVGTLLEP